MSLCSLESTQQTKATLNSISQPTNEITFQFPRQVRWRDTDASGFAHMAAYINWMEETEYAFLRARGLSVVLSDDKGRIGFPRWESELEILTPVTLDEELLVSLRLSRLDGKLISYHFETIRVADKALVAVGQFTLACCRFPDADLPYAILIPEWIEEKLLNSSEA